MSVRPGESSGWIDEALPAKVYGSSFSHMCNVQDVNATVCLCVLQCPTTNVCGAGVMQAYLQSQQQLLGQCHQLGLAECCLISLGACQALNECGPLACERCTSQLDSRGLHTHTHTGVQQQTPLLTTAALT